MKYDSKFQISSFSQNIIILTSLISKSLKFCEIRKKFGEILTKICKICCLSWNSVKISSNSVKNGAKVLKNQRNMEWCKGKNVELEKRWKMRPWTQKSALIQPKTSLGKGLKNVYSKGLRWLYLQLPWPSSSQLSVSGALHPLYLSSFSGWSSIFGVTTLLQ